MKLTLYQVDAFAERLFKGNPAAVIPLQQWINDELMQQLAMENNLSETVFFVPRGNDFDIRWFTPEAEINLCGHATLASAFVLMNFLGYNDTTLVFHSKSGPLFIHREGDIIYLDFPSWKPERLEAYPEWLAPALGNPEIVGVYRHRDLLVELQDAAAVSNCSPDLNALKPAGEKLIITAPGERDSGIDFVSRFFAPSVGVNEDPVTGSAHSQLIPFWSEKTGKTVLKAQQRSQRGGELYCEQKGDRVIMGGRCAFFMKGEIELH